MKTSAVTAEVFLSPRGTIMYMDKVATAIVLGVVGLAFGSFVNAAVYRIRSKRALSLLNERSECVHCHHTLAWYDLIPVISWISLRGKCRYCRGKIEDTPLPEVGVAAAYVVSFLFWPYALTSTSAVIVFGLWLIDLVLLAVLFIYDRRYMLLPNKIVWTLALLGIVQIVIEETAGGGSLTLVWNAVLSVAILSGIYAALYVVSKGKWIGFGDVKLGIFLGLTLHDWRLALLALFAANLFGLLVILPGLISGKLSRQSQVPFGPFLILGCIASMLFGPYFVQSFLYALVV